MQRGKKEVLCRNPKRASIKKTSEMCTPVKASASNDNSTAVIQKQINPARMKNQWALRNSDNEKVSLPVRSSGEAPLTEQPSAFSCLVRTVQPFMLLSPSPTQGPSPSSKQDQNLGEKQKKKIKHHLGWHRGSQKTASKSKPTQRQHGIWKSETELGADGACGARESDGRGPTSVPPGKTVVHMQRDQTLVHALL